VQLGCGCTGGQLLRCEVCDHTETFTSLLRVGIWDEGGTGYYGVPAESKSKGF
jgi:hypothetical protein